MRILFISAENAPFVQIGGLSQVVALLANAVRKCGYDVRTFMPKYGVIKTKKYHLVKEVDQMPVPTGHKEREPFPTDLICNVLASPGDKRRTQTYFLENREYFELRANVYGYADEHIRFYLLSIGCLEWLLHQKQTGGWLPDIIHAHDWHTGYLVDAIKNNPRYRHELQDIKILFTIHNFKHQGNFNFKYASNPDDGKGPLLPAFHPDMRKQNPMLRSILNADMVNTVSATYAIESQTPDFGERLDPYLRDIAHKYSGISNGVDVRHMNPATDKNIAANYSAGRLSKRSINKKALQKLFRLPLEPRIPIVSFVGRFDAQKGFETIFRALEHIESLPLAQYIFVGGGDDSLCNELMKLTKKYPDRVAAVFELNFLLPRKIFAGSDLILMPSRFEPGGIVAMEALRYGCVPLAAKTGGLSETVQPFDVSTGQGNGFLHTRNDLWSFTSALVSALQLYAIPQIWKKIVINGMKCDFSWDNTASQYTKLYRTLLRTKNKLKY